MKKRSILVNGLNVKLTINFDSLNIKKRGDKSWRIQHYIENGDREFSMM